MTEDTLPNEVVRQISHLHKHRKQMLAMMEGWEIRIKELANTLHIAEDEYKMDLDALKARTAAHLKGFGADHLLTVPEIAALFPAPAKAKKSA